MIDCSIKKALVTAITSTLMCQIRTPDTSIISHSEYIVKSFFRTLRIILRGG